MTGCGSSDIIEAERMKAAAHSAYSRCGRVTDHAKVVTRGRVRAEVG